MLTMKEIALVLTRDMTEQTDAGMHFYGENGCLSDQHEQMALEIANEALFDAQTRSVIHNGGLRVELSMLGNKNPLHNPRIIATFSMSSRNHLYVQEVEENLNRKETITLFRISPMKNRPRHEYTHFSAAFPEQTFSLICKQQIRKMEDERLKLYHNVAELDAMMHHFGLSFQDISKLSFLKENPNGPDYFSLPSNAFDNRTSIYNDEAARRRVINLLGGVPHEIPKTEFVWGKEGKKEKIS